MKQKIAVILFNLGGPDCEEAVRPFLLNLFNDPAILRVPDLWRGLLARWIVWRRAPIAREIYRQLGGGSPLLVNTQAQAQALESRLGAGFRCFIAMRYWHPFSDEVWELVKEYAPDKIVFLPLYPQFSTTTTLSSFEDMLLAAQGKLDNPQHDILRTVCCYPSQAGLIAAHTDLLRPVLVEAMQYGSPRVLFSAHGIPEQLVIDGDPYAVQCAETAQAIINKLTERVNDRTAFSAVDFVQCYQSKVGRLKWLEPSTEAEIIRAGQEKRPLVIVPLSFVSEHSETLVELDREYAELAEEKGVPYYGRVPAVGTHPLFIQGLADLVHGAVADPVGPIGSQGANACREGRCPFRCWAKGGQDGHGGHR